MKNYEVTINGEVYQVSLKEIDEVAGQKIAATDTPANPVAPADSANSSGTIIQAPMAGNILAIKVNAGDAVKKGDVLLTLEAMKMENEIVAAADGTVLEVLVKVSDSVESGQGLIKI